MPIFPKTFFRDSLLQHLQKKKLLRWILQNVHEKFKKKIFLCKRWYSKNGLSVFPDNDPRSTLFKNNDFIPDLINKFLNMQLIKWNFDYSIYKQLKYLYLLILIYIYIFDKKKTFHCHHLKS